MDNNCPSCSSQDNILVEGKQFCTSCGTPFDMQKEIHSEPISSEHFANTAQSPFSKFSSLSAQATSYVDGISNDDNPNFGTTDDIHKSQNHNPNLNQNNAPQVQATNQPLVQSSSYPQSNTITSSVTDAPVVVNDQSAIKEDMPAPANRILSPSHTSDPSAQLKGNSFSTPALENNSIAIAGNRSNPSASAINQIDNFYRNDANTTSSSSPVNANRSEPSNTNTNTPEVTSTDSLQNIPATTMPSSYPNTHSQVLSLDKNSSNVFSDEELDELSSAVNADPSNSIEDSNKVESKVMPRISDIYGSRNVQTSTDEVNGNQSASTSSANQAQLKEPEIKPVDDRDVKKLKSKRKLKKNLKPAGIGLSILGLFLAGAFIWKTNYPNLAFKIASSKAGISATLPGYVPSGYGLSGEIQTNPGTVSYTLLNSLKDNKLSISQSKTEWDSQALAENYIAPKAQNYLALQTQGLTVYMVGNSQASWVNKGMWYKIESPNNSLTKEEVLKMVSSL